MVRAERRCTDKFDVSPLESLVDERERREDDSDELMGDLHRVEVQRLCHLPPVRRTMGANLNRRALSWEASFTKPVTKRGPTFALSWTSG